MYTKAWKPVEINILLTAVEQKGIQKGSAIAGKRLKRTPSSCLQKYYKVKQTLPSTEAPAPEPKKVKPKAPISGVSMVTGKLVARGEELLVVKAEGKFIMINI